MNSFRLIGIIGLICIIIGVVNKNRTQQNIYYIAGGVFLAIYSTYLEDVIYIVLQIIFIIAAAYDLWVQNKNKS